MEEEDWKHHKAYDDYLHAVEEMLEHTETEWAPWTMVPATDRHATRIQVFETLVSRLDEALERAGHGVPEEAQTEIIDEYEED